VKVTVVYVVTIATRDVVIGEQLKCKREPDNEMIDSYVDGYYEEG